MNVPIDQWRVSIGLFHGITARCIYGEAYSWSLPILVKYLTSVFRDLQFVLSSSLYSLTDNIKNNHVILIIMTLLFLSFDIELNPGPFNSLSDLSILHLNIRSIRNKFDFIKDNFLDFNILCFSENRLDWQISNGELLLSDTFDQPYSKDRTNHGGGLLIYLNSDKIQDINSKL